MPVPQATTSPPSRRRILLAALLAATAAPAFACGTEAYTGQICVWAGNYCPNNTVEATGQLLQISSYNALYSLVGTVYGGDGRTTFGLPDLRGRAPIGYGQGVSSQNTPLTSHAVGAKFGAEAVVMTQAQMPQHTHAATFTAGGGGGGGTTTVAVAVGAAAGDTTVPAASSTVYLAGEAIDYGGDPVNVQGPYTNTAPGTGTTATLGGITVAGGGSSGTVTLAPTGASQLTPVVNPEIALRFCVVLNGLYPPRP